MGEQAFFLYDLHLRTSPRQGMDDLVRKASDAGFRSFGVVGDIPGNDPFGNFFSCFLSKTIAYPQKMSTFAASNEKYDIKTKWCIRLEV